MRLSAATQRIGVPKGRLDRWEHEGRISCSFTRETRITGAGVVDMRMWFPDDADAIKARVPTLEAQDAERRRRARAERRRAAEQRKLEPGYRTAPKRVMGRNVTPCDSAATVEAAIGNAHRKDGADRDRADDTTTRFIAIDPHGAKDRDDAVWAKRLDPGSWHVKVAVADVGAYVQAQSPLDAAVRQRAQTTYLVNECIHMCPERLSSEICSLHEGGRKRALVTEFTVNEQGDVTPTRAMERAWVAIDRAITYEQAKTEINASACATLSALDGCAQALRRRVRRASAREHEPEAPKHPHRRADQGRRDRGRGRRSHRGGATHPAAGSRPRMKTRHGNVTRNSAGAPREERHSKTTTGIASDRNSAVTPLGLFQTAARADTATATRTDNPHLSPRRQRRAHPRYPPGACSTAAVARHPTRCVRRSKALSSAHGNTSYGVASVVRSGTDNGVRGAATRRVLGDGFPRAGTRSARGALPR